MLRVRVAIIALACLAAAFGCRDRAAVSRSPRKLVVLGFDGLDARLTAQWMQERRLPTFAELATRGRFAPLVTTLPPESVTAWAAFATGVNPGQHDIFGEVWRDPATYVPRIGLVDRQPGRFWLGYVPIAAPRVSSRLRATSFWTRLDRAGLRASVLAVPLTFPPEPLAHGELLAGFPLPDVRDTNGTFQYFATDVPRYQEGPTEFGGIVRRLTFTNSVAQTELLGPADPVVAQRLAAIPTRPDGSAPDPALAALRARQFLRLPLTIRWNRDAPGGPTATVEIQGHSVHLADRGWSRWIPLDFRANLLVRVHGLAQFYLASAGRALRLYVSPINWNPEHPPLPISSPSSFAENLYERLGPYRTLGWGEATGPLQDGFLDEATFMDDMYRAFDDRAQVILNRIDAGNWDLLVGVIDSPDRVQHLMWRLIDPQHPKYDPALAGKQGDAIERVYRRCDQFVAQVLERLDPGTTLLIVSDHGFQSWRKAVNLNTWLVQQGYQGRLDAVTERAWLDGLLAGGDFWRHVEWSRTRAYAIGYGQIYVNLRGREARGLVAAGAEYDGLVQELADRLLRLRDPETGEPVVRAVYKRSDISHGPFDGDAPDLQVGFAPGYRVSWQTVAGGAPPGIVYPNARPWSGDHASVDYRAVAGMVISSVPIASGEPRLVDIAPTVLKYFGVPIPGKSDGKPLF